ncbi:hypothetical protein GLOTRDRAFT_124170 [Gloeophyllum trabeum ATCC 11539]|uniref:Uncharacterized protein n=1 Tax=Gloeophyllum trabeum (strain ATCC 11539 / FP-39264 / Madison 617) TaxID=670483 RepID=S7QLU1_GLOTA|nr:uncharacterized protein GLOTRDRAFT_124170 [Gloeophyllum trabeum ATCC 11539]EPQ60413.1 hypothetical protein GLOTRDRAFT_124170 [Gloeophyllum trabeum ATCC 11539]
MLGSTISVKPSHSGVEHLEHNPPIPQTIHIARDNEAVRSLGAWIGNKTDAAAPWEAILDKIAQRLTHLLKGHPTLFSKAHMVQQTFGGMTQYLTKVQGMPPYIVTTLEKLLQSFIWEEAASNLPVALAQLYLPKEKGGLDLLNINARNDAIELTWLRTYLDLSPTRPDWAFVVDALINTLAPDGIATEALFNTFLQTWAVPGQGKRAVTLPTDVLSMLKTARKYGVAFAPAKLSASLKAQLPAYYLLGTPPRTYAESQTAHTSPAPTVAAGRAMQIGGTGVPTHINVQ